MKHNIAGRLFLNHDKLKHIGHPRLLVSTALWLLLITSCQSGNATNTQSQESLFTIAPGSPISIPGEPGNVVIGDVNNDKKLDLVVALGKNRSITVLPGKGDGQFAAPAGTTTVPDSPGDMALGDVNGDGKLDLAIVTHDSYGASLLLGDGKGGFSIAPNSPIVMKVGQHPHTHGLALADMNRDNKLDLVTVNNADNDVSIALGDGRGAFTIAPGSPFAVGPSPYPLAVGDVNGDGQLDIVATATATGPSRAQQLALSRALTLLLSDGRGGFRSTQLPLRTGEPWFAVISDLNGDRKPDILATHHELNQLTVMLGDGKGGFVEATTSPFDFGHNAYHAVVMDVNRDDKMDVLAAGGDSVLVMLGDGRGGFARGPAIQPGRGTWRLDKGDLNGDGRMDLVTSNSESGTVCVLLGR
ncbi:MAG TPA: VCBS repeat-containing protein [Pyrinomonadaceae bacterium]|nr:VCBS repeat-containing protein [Pyrinomonadaceae bacterium]